MPAEGQCLGRMSISLSEDLLAELDTVVGERGFASRSQAISDMIHQYVVEHKSQRGTDVMVGIVTLFYNNAVRDLQKQIADLQARHIDEVISSLHVHLMNNQTMEVILVQGPARKLQGIADKMITRRGMISGKMQLIAAVIPPLHPLPKECGGLRS
jgi:CopG family transcriptional regulator, nickel-responsive regulator